MMSYWMIGIGAARLGCLPAYLRTTSIVYRQAYSQPNISLAAAGTGRAETLHADAIAATSHRRPARWMALTALGNSLAVTK